MSDVQISVEAQAKSSKPLATGKSAGASKPKAEPFALLDDAMYGDSFEALSPSEKNAVFKGVGEELARTLGAQVIAQMLNDTSLSGREIGAKLGFDHSALSRIARGDSKTGPTLWKVFALAEALGYRIELNAVKK